MDKQLNMCSSELKGKCLSPIKYSIIIIIINNDRCSAGKFSVSVFIHLLDNRREKNGFFLRHSSSTKNTWNNFYSL